MRVDRLPSPRLRPEKDVAVGEDGTLAATGSEPWLAFAAFDPSWRGAFVEIVYRASLLDEPVRPVFRFLRAAGAVADRVGNAPWAGSAIWIGRVPADATALQVSPTHRPGRFDFIVESVARRSWLSLVAVTLRRSPRYAWRALVLRLVGLRPEADAMLAWGLGSRTPLRRSATWRAARRRPFDIGGLDRPRIDWTQTKSVFVILPGVSGGCAPTCRALQAQIATGWSALVVAPERPPPGDPRFASIRKDDLRAALERLADTTFVCVLRAGDRLDEGALAYVVEQASRHPQDRVFHGDVIAVDGACRETLLLSPGWSPTMCRPVFVRAGHLPSMPSCEAFLGTGTPSRDLLSSGARPLRRVLATIPRELPMAPVAPGPMRSGATTTSIIVPTRGGADLLTRLIASIRDRSSPAGLQVVLVNNGGSREAIRQVATRVAPRLAIEVIDFDRAFNFSAICNAGVAASTGDVVVFLNDDIEALSADWLDRLAAHAIEPDIGAVGAKLTYPDGRLQHVGVVVGLGGDAGHFGARAAGDAPGWADWNVVPHEVGAVTGACLAVTRAKFDAVGGFDATTFPVESGDVDLCLKLRARGYKTLFDPQVHLLHAESKSRGRATFRRLAVHAAEREAFRRRWAHVIRDDPAFHPGLSLYSREAGLG